MNQNASKLPREFYLQTNVLQITRQLLGKVLVTQIEGHRTAGIIVEAEAYAAKNDRASHAYRGRATQRTEIMFGPGGVSYVYLIYGIHVLFNVVTNKAGIADAILIRAVEPLEGLEVMRKRRRMPSLKPEISNGPGKLTKALGIDLSFYGLDLTGSTIWIEDQGIQIPDERIASGPRIGIDYAGIDALRPWRFWLRNNPYVSKP